MQVYKDATKEDKEMIEGIYNKATADIDQLSKDHITANPTSLYALEEFARYIDYLPIDSIEAKLCALQSCSGAGNRNIAN